jgi:acyl carrier protein
MPPGRIDPDKSVFDLGMDSLMAMELRLAIEERFAIDLPTMAIAEGATITRLAERIRDRLLGLSRPNVSDQVSEVLGRHSEDASVDVAAITARLANPTSTAERELGAARAGVNPKS